MKLDDCSISDLIKIPFSFSWKTESANTKHPLSFPSLSQQYLDAVYAVLLQLTAFIVHCLCARHCSTCFHLCRQIENTLMMKQTFSLQLWKYSSDRYQRLNRAVFLTKWSTKSILITFALMCIISLNTCFVIVVAYLYVIRQSKQ